MIFTREKSTNYPFELIFVTGDISEDFTDYSFKTSATRSVYTLLENLKQKI